MANSINGSNHWQEFNYSDLSQEEAEGRCGICQEEFSQGAPLIGHIEDKVKHCFHYRCFNGYVSFLNTPSELQCPLDRRTCVLSDDLRGELNSEKWMRLLGNEHILRHPLLETRLGQLKTHVASADLATITAALQGDYIGPDHIPPILNGYAIEGNDRAVAYLLRACGFTFKNLSIAALWAVKKGHLEVFTLIRNFDQIAHKGYLSTSGYFIGQCLLEAIDAGHLEMARSFLQEPVVLNGPLEGIVRPTEPYILGQALVKALSHGYEEMALEILRQDREISECGLGEALVKALSHGYEEMSLEILNQDREIAGHYLGNALKIAIDKRFMGVIEYILEEDVSQADAQTALEAAVKQGYHEIVHLLLASELSISIEKREEAILLAAEKGDIPTVKELFSGAEISPYTISQAVARAAMQGHQEMVLWLREDQLEIDPFSCSIL